MKKNKNIIIIVLFLLIIAISVVIVYIKMTKDDKHIDNNKETSVQKDTVNYKDIDTFNITYYDDRIPGSKRDIKISSNNIEIDITYFCSTSDCTPEDLETEKRERTYSQENIDKLKKFLVSNFDIKNNDNIEIRDDDLNTYQSYVMTSLSYTEVYFELAVEEYEYKIDYSNNDINYIIYFKDDNSVLVKKYIYSDDIEIIDTYAINFSKENINKINRYVKTEAIIENDNYINKDDDKITDYERKIINSIIKNDESYLK